jgi:hypothetical protein
MGAHEAHIRYQNARILGLVMGCTAAVVDRAFAESEGVADSKSECHFAV